MTAAGNGIPAPGHRETGEPMAGGSMGLPSKWRAAGPDGSLFPMAHHTRGERHRKDDEQDDPEQSFESGGPVRDEVQSSGEGASLADRHSRHLRNRSLIGTPLELSFPPGDVDSQQDEDDQQHQQEQQGGAHRPARKRTIDDIQSDGEKPRVKEVHTVPSLFSSVPANEHNCEYDGQKHQRCGPY